MATQNHLLIQLGESARRNHTPGLALALASSSLTLAESAVSFYKGYDVRYQPGTRPIKAKMHTRKTLYLALAARRVGRTSYQLWLRKQGRAPYTKFDEVETLQLFTDIAGSIAIVALAARGKLKAGQPMSVYGRARTTLSLCSATMVVLSSSAELYRRRRSWLPEVYEFTEGLRQSLQHQADPYRAEKQAFIDGVNRDLNRIMYGSDHTQRD